MPKWSTSSRSSCPSPVPPCAASGASKNFPRRRTALICRPSASANRAYLGPAGARRSTATTVLSTSHGSSSRLTVSTSGSSGIGDLPFVQRPTDYGALQAEALVQIEIGVSRYAATCHQSAVERIARGRHGFRIDPTHGAVTVDIGVDEVGHTTLLHGPCQRQGVHGRVFRPAPHGNVPAPCVDRHSHPVGTEALHHGCDQVGTAHGQSANDHPVHH